PPHVPSFPTRRSSDLALRESVDAYIRQHYDQDVLKCVYINSDGGSWIRAAANYVGKSRLVADRFHLMKYINRVARYTLDEERITDRKSTRLNSSHVSI